MLAKFLTPDLVRLTLEDGEAYVTLVGPVEVDITVKPGLMVWDALVADGITIEPADPVVPDAPTNSDWRVGLVLWGRFADIEQRVIQARDSGTIEGTIAWQRWEYANNVYRAELMALKDAFGFSAAEVDESLYRAAAVAAASSAA